MKAKMLLRNGRIETKEGDPTEIKYWIERKFRKFQDSELKWIDFQVQKEGIERPMEARAQMPSSREVM